MNATHRDPLWSFSTRSDLVVVGRNMESADITNPQGYIYGLLWFVSASNAHGDTRELAVVSAAGSNDTREAAEKLATRLGARLRDLGKLPVGFDLWPQGRPVYGSDAYVEYGQADDLAWERRQEDDRDHL